MYPAAVAAAFLIRTSSAFHLAGRIKPQHVVRIISTTALSATGNNNGDDSPVQEYKNAPTKILSNFMGKPAEDENEEDGTTPTINPIDSIDFDAPKFNQKVDLDTLAAILDYEITEKEWFVTGRVNPIYFSDDFEFQDPDVKLSGIEDYARGVYKLFDQTCSRAEIISTVKSDEVPRTITCTWRLSGKVSIGPGLTIKPYICYTDFTVDEGTGLITMQEDRFDIPQWDILLSALFPFLIGRVTSAPAPPAEPRVVTMPSIAAAAVGKGADGSSSSSPFEKLIQMFS